MFCTQSKIPAATEMLFLAKFCEMPGVCHGMNTLSQFTKPFHSWVATCSMSLIYILDGEVSEGMLLTCPSSGLENVTESWWSSHLSRVLTLGSNTKFMAKSEFIEILPVYVSSNQGHELCITNGSLKNLPLTKHKLDFQFFF